MLEVGTGFHAELTGRENIYLNGAILGMSKAEITEKIDKIIEFSECEKFIDTPVKRYSSGMFVKLAFAVAAHLDAEILIMDEVLAVGDMQFQKKCIAKMRELALNENRTVLYVSHNMNTIRELCSRCIVLDHGKKIFDGDVENAIKICLRIEVSDYRRFPVTAFVIEDFYSGNKGEKASMRFKINIARIASGGYYTRYVFYNRKSDTLPFESVEIAAGLRFRKRMPERNGNRWQKAWGSVVMDEIELDEEN